MIVIAIFSEIFSILLATTLAVGLFYPEVVINILLSIVKDKKTGAFDLIVQGVKVAKSLSIAIDAQSAFKAVMIDRSSHVVVVRAIEIDNMDLYIVKAEDGERSGATLNLWACLGSKNDEEATTMLSTIRKSINKVIGMKGGLFDVRGLFNKTADQNQSKTSPASSLQPVMEEENKSVQYKIQLSRFVLKRLTLHSPAYLGPSAPPIILTGIELVDLSAATGASMDDLLFNVVGQVIQRIVAKHPVVTMGCMIRGAMSLGRGIRDTGLGLENNMHEFVSSGLGDSVTTAIDEALEPPIVNIDGAGLARTMLDPTMDYLNNVIPGFQYVSYSIDGLLSGASMVNREIVTTVSMFRIPKPKLNPNSQPSQPVVLFESTR